MAQVTTGEIDSGLWHGCVTKSCQADSANFWLTLYKLHKTKIHTCSFARLYVMGIRDRIKRLPMYMSMIFRYGILAGYCESGYWLCEVGRIFIFPEVGENFRIFLNLKINTPRDRVASSSLLRRRIQPCSSLSGGFNRTWGTGFYSGNSGRICR